MKLRYLHLREYPPLNDVPVRFSSGSPLDREGLRRATSVYFPGTVLPMLPERLSNGICSLNPDVDRLCMVCDLALDESGRRSLGVDVVPQPLQLAGERAGDVR